MMTTTLIVLVGLLVLGVQAIAVLHGEGQAIAVPLGEVLVIAVLHGAVAILVVEALAEIGNVKTLSAASSCYVP